MYWLVMTMYTARKMTNPSDSLNAILGMLSAWERGSLILPCAWGLPLAFYPQSLGWIHKHSVSPNRRADFPSWSFVGWEGEVTIDELLLLQPIDRRDIHNPVRDMTVKYLGVDGRKLDVEGWVVELHVRTDPFSEALAPGTEDMLGYVTERNHFHPNTLPTGVYTCLVVERIVYQAWEGGPTKQRVFMVVLEREGEVAVRRTVITLTTPSGGEFLRAEPVLNTLTLV